MHLILFEAFSSGERDVHRGPFRRRRIHARSADLSANGPSMRSPGRYIGGAPINWAPTRGPVLVVKVHNRPLLVRQASCGRGARAWHPQGKGATASAILSVILSPFASLRVNSAKDLCPAGDPSPSLRSGLRLTALRMTTLFIDQMKLDCTLRCPDEFVNLHDIRLMREIFLADK
jgi:hypothetical protein